MQKGNIMKRRSWTITARDLDTQETITTLNVRACNRKKAVEFWKRDHYWVKYAEIISVEEERR